MRTLADQFVAPWSVSFSKQIPLLLVGFGVSTALVSAISNPTWIPFGPMFALGGILMWLVLGDDRGGGPLKERFLRWLTVWPMWEYALLLVVVIWIAGLAVLHQAWVSTVMGLVMGIAAVSIFYLTVVFSLRRERAEIEQSFRSVVSELTETGVDPRAVCRSMPIAMGKNWISLFRRQYGQENYRKEAERLIVEHPELLECRPRWQDFFCDFLGECIRYRLGPLRSMMSLPRCNRFLRERRDVTDYVSKLSAAETGRTDSLRSQMELADAWWAVSENARTMSYRRAAKRRAVQIYEQIYELIPDPMEQMHVRTRIDVVMDGNEEPDIDAIGFQPRCEPSQTS